MYKYLIITFIVFTALIVCFLLFFYRSDFQVCLAGRVCTSDIRSMCNLITGENRTVSSGCSCGIDAKTLKIRGWVDCPKKFGNTIKQPPQISGKCGIESCHGTDITCGPNVPEICDQMYKAGDNCRQFASCQTVDSKCMIDRTPQFDKCINCVEKCRQGFNDDQVEFFQCESKCAK